MAVASAVETEVEVTVAAMVEVPVVDTEAEKAEVARVVERVAEMVEGPAVEAMVAEEKVAAVMAVVATVVAARVEEVRVEGRCLVSWRPLLSTTSLMPQVSSKHWSTTPASWA